MKKLFVIMLILFLFPLVFAEEVCTEQETNLLIKLQFQQSLKDGEHELGEPLQVETLTLRNYNKCVLYDIKLSIWFEHPETGRKEYIYKNESKIIPQISSNALLDIKARVRPTIDLVLPGYWELKSSINDKESTYKNRVDVEELEENKLFVITPQEQIEKLMLKELNESGKTNDRLFWVTVLLAVLTIFMYSVSKKLHNLECMKLGFKWRFSNSYFKDITQLKKLIKEKNLGTVMVKKRIVHIQARTMESHIMQELKCVFKKTMYKDKYKDNFPNRFIIIVKKIKACLCLFK